MLLYLQTQVNFPLGGKSVTYRGAEVAHDQVVLFETAASLRASQRQANDLFRISSILEEVYQNTPRPQCCPRLRLGLIL